jgi:Helicase HerA, central domain
MTYYQIKEVEYSQQQDPYFIYQGKEEKEVLLNFGYTKARDLLETIHTLAKSEKDLTLNILYHNQQIQYFIRSEKSDFLKSLQQNTPQIAWSMNNNSFNLSFSEKDKITLKGCSSPFVIKDRSENLLDELIKMLPRESFLIQVKFSVKEDDEINNQILTLEKHISHLAQEAAIQVGEQSNIGENIKKIFVGGENYSYQLKNITAQQQLEMLENHMYTLKTQGYIFKNVEWNIYAESNEITNSIASKMKSFSRRSGNLNFYRLQQAIEKKNDKEDISHFSYLDLVPSNYISTIIALPTSGVPGINLKSRIEFGSELLDFEKEKCIDLGKLIKNHNTNIDIKFPLNDLTKHTFVSGVTGSGKTSTIKSLLNNVFNNENIPFLIIEPAKTEYKYLQNSISSLKILTLGIEGVNSFKINPFSFPQGIHIQTHVDYLKSVFIAAFPMYGPMPYILETALYSIYRRCGWDFLSGQNIYQNTLSRNQLFPTLEDLYLEIDDAITKVGYSNDLSNDIRGALKVRIGSLLSGAKGSMLNTQEGMSIEQLLETPIVMELEYLGDDQEKVFLIGLLLITIYEYFVSKGRYTINLKHLLVIEEAHRLLEKVQTNQSNESANMKGKALETFNNILSEIRAYGQGIVIADQIPSKLSPDIIKNTNLKIVHRLFDKEDRDIIGNSIGLAEDQTRELIKLKQGETVIFHGELENSLKLKINVDTTILAADQDYHQLRVPVSKELNIVQFFIQDDILKSAGYKCLNTYLLFPEILGEIEQEISNIIDKKMLIRINQNDYTYLWAELIKRYTKEYRFIKVFSYYEDVLLRNLLMESDEDPLNQFGGWIKSQFKTIIRPHAMERQSSIYHSYCFLRKVTGFEDKGIYVLINKYRDKLTYDNPSVSEIIIRESLISRYINVSLLNREQKVQLANAIIIYEFGDDFGFLESYFKYRKLI